MCNLCASSRSLRETQMILSAYLPASRSKIGNSHRRRRGAPWVNPQPCAVKVVGTRSRKLNRPINPAIVLWQATRSGLNVNTACLKIRAPFQSRQRQIVLAIEPLGMNVPPSRCVAFCNHPPGWLMTATSWPCWTNQRVSWATCVCAPPCSDFVMKKKMRIVSSMTQ